MALEKLYIHVETATGVFDDGFPVLFNPNQVTMTKRGWKDGADGPVTDDSPTTLNMDLFFDTMLIADLWKKQPKSVDSYTQPVFQLVQIDGALGRPPLCKLTWGGFSQTNTLMEQGILKTVTKTLNQFLEDGTPVRATLSCSFEAWQDPTEEAKRQNLIDDPIRVVRRGETLSSIANEEYGDPALWRAIAIENRMNNPRKLVPGAVLTIPPLTSAQTTGGG